MRETVADVVNDDPLPGDRMDQRGVSDAVKEVVGIPPGKDSDTGTFGAGLIINILAHVPIRRYRLTACFDDTPLPVLVPWQPAVHAAQWNDARAGQVLDDLWPADPQQVRGAVVPRVIPRDQPDRHQRHVDTTRQSVSGA